MSAVRAPRLGERGQRLALLAPYAIGTLLLVVLPGAVTLALALFRWDLLTSPVAIGVENFTDLLGDPLFGKALVASLAFMAVAVPLRLAAATGLALLMHRRDRGAGAQRTAAYLPTVVPDAAYALLWLFLLNPLYGPVNMALGALGLPEPAWLTTGTGAMAAVILLSLFTVGEGFVVALATRQELPEEIYELAQVEGSSPLHTLRRVTLPLMAPTLALLAFRDTALTLQATFVPALLLTGGGPDRATTFLPLLVYDTAFEDLRYGYAAAMTVTMLIVTAAIVLVQYLIVRGRRFGLAR